MGNLKLGNIRYVPRRIYVNESMIIEPLVRLGGQKQFVCSVQDVSEDPRKVYYFFEKIHIYSGYAGLGWLDCVHKAQENK